MYKIESIVIVESVFKRVPNIPMDREQLRNEVFITVSGNANEVNEVQKIMVELNVSVKGKIEEEIKFEINIKSIGSFIHEGENFHLSVEDFKNINGPAIMFPFIREHVSSLCLKGGLGSVLLQPVNFVRKERKE